MKHTALVLLLLCLCYYAQAQDDVSTPGTLEYSKGVVPVTGQGQAWYEVKGCGGCFCRIFAGDTNFAYKISADSCVYVLMPDFNHIHGAKPVRFRDGTHGFIVFGDQDEYGSGGGALSRGFAVISGGEQPRELFSVVTSCGIETFGRSYADGSTTEAGTIGYERRVEFKANGDIIIHPNTPELAKINEKETCEITKIASGTYRYLNGKYSKVN